MERKKVAIGYLRFNKKDNRRYKKAVKEVFKIIMEKEGYKVIGIIEEIYPNKIRLDTRAKLLLERICSGEFFGARHILVLRREDLGANIKEIDFVIKALIQEGLYIYSYLDNDLNSNFDKYLVFQDAVAKVMNDGDK